MKIQITMKKGFNNYISTKYRRLYEKRIIWFFSTTKISGVEMFAQKFALEKRERIFLRANFIEKNKKLEF